MVGSSGTQGRVLVGTAGMVAGNAAGKGATSTSQADGVFFRTRNKSCSSYPINRIRSSSGSVFFRLRLEVFERKVLEYFEVLGTWEIMELMIL